MTGRGCEGPKEHQGALRPQISGLTDWRTDTPTYRDARTYLSDSIFCFIVNIQIGASCNHFPLDHVCRVSCLAAPWMEFICSRRSVALIDDILQKQIKFVKKPLFLFNKLLPSAQTCILFYEDSEPQICQQIKNNPKLIFGENLFILAKIRNIQGLSRVMHDYKTKYLSFQSS